MNPLPTKKVVFVVDEKNLPPPAPMGFRVAAFVADSVLIFFLSAISVKFLLPVFCPEGIFVFSEYYQEIQKTYETSLLSAVNGNTASTALLDEVLVRAANNETLVEFFEIIYTISFLSAAIYFVLTEFFMRGQTLGKRIFGLRTVIFGTPFPPLFLQILSRALWKAFTVVPSGMLLVILAIVNANIVAFSRRHRGWHDKLARTEVIDLRALEGKSARSMRF